MVPVADATGEDVSPPGLAPTVSRKHKVDAIWLVSRRQ